MPRDCMNHCELDENGFLVPCEILQAIIYVYFMYWSIFISFLFATIVSD